MAIGFKVYFKVLFKNSANQLHKRVNFKTKKQHLKMMLSDSNI